jgi:hypothetical protein
MKIGGFTTNDGRPVALEMQLEPAKVPKTESYQGKYGLRDL